MCIIYKVDGFALVSAIFFTFVTPFVFYKILDVVYGRCFNYLILFPSLFQVWELLRQTDVRVAVYVDSMQVFPSNPLYTT